MENKYQDTAPAGCKFLAIVILFFMFLCFCIGLVEVGKILIKYVFSPLYQYLMSKI